MDVSIVIPVYNMEKYLAQCMDCAIGQTLKDIEIICVDDGSTDSSLDILRGYEKRDARVKVITQKNSYSGVARNNGIKLAAGKYLAFFDPDDFYKTDMIELMFAQAEKCDAEMCVCTGEYYYNDTGRYAPWNGIDRRYTPKKEVFRASELGKNAFSFMYHGPTNKLIKRELVDRYNLRFLDTRVNVDFSFICLCTALAERITVYDKKPLAYYRQSLTTNAQSTVHLSQLDGTKAWRALKEGLEAAGVFDRYRAAYENCVAAGLRNHANKICDYPRSFAGFAEWYRREGKKMCDIHLKSMDVSTAFLVLAAFEGVTDETDDEEAARRISQNIRKYKGLSSGHQKERLLFVVRDIKKRCGTFAAVGSLVRYIFEEVGLKIRNRA